MKRLRFMNNENYTIVLTCDFTADYCIEITFNSEFRSFPEAEHFASCSVGGVEITNAGCKVIAENVPVSSVSCHDFIVKKIKESSRNKVVYDADADYDLLNCDIKHLFGLLCKEYGNRSSFFFSNSAYSVKKA